MTQRESTPVQGMTHRVELIISRLLRWGVLASLFLFVAGTLVSFLHYDYGNTAADLSPLITRTGNFPHTIAWLEHGLRVFSGQSLIVLGVLFLISTPLLRVMVSVAAYAVERDFSFALITFAVLALLLVSLWMGAHG